MRVRNSLLLRFIVPVSVLVVLLVAAGATVFSLSEAQRIDREIAAQARQQMRGVNDLMGVTDALMNQQTRAAMNILIERSRALGAATLGPAVAVKGKTVPGLMFGGKPQNLHYELVDGVVRAMGGTATLFVRHGDEFVRVSTNVKTEGERAIGTVLDPAGKAIAAILKGQAFYGKVDILGTPYITGYEPIRDAQGQTIGIWYVGYKVDMAVLKDIVGATRLLASGFVAIVDEHDKVRFRSGHVDDDNVVKTVKVGSTGWNVLKEDFPAWGFRILAAYPEREVADISRERIGEIAAVGVLSCALLIALLVVLLRRQVIAPVQAAMQAALQIAEGDLTVDIAVTSSDETGRLMSAMKNMVLRLRQIVDEIRISANELTSASSQVAATSQGLSQATSQQAASLEETTAAVEEMSASIAQNTDNAKATDGIAHQASQDALSGGEAVKSTVEAMKSIAGRISIIDDIAYRTDLLALNAAIEAARAGEHGKGFAVVAAEVRKLAERSQVAAQEIGELAASSVDQAEQAGKLLETMLPSIRKTADLVREITAASEEQTTGAGQISQAMTQLNSVTQQNAAASEELSATAEEMNAQAESLKQLMARFKVSGYEGFAGLAAVDAAIVAPRAAPVAGKTPQAVELKDFVKY
ncbi:methyl-accepting chemotaxis protein [Propionivibrio dicarboxylicus]|uniref:Methyl-accepting chemotaxis protein n=1 Tax=Propionivibrio dicarboxylicus TaxID=83767 RepID=A0A1G8KN97_9RHOO|nr:Cache 3/Cache 2 fusion domain-containing protein [Propionivibrio dicarboxylicus]SDI44822.1 Methyl-accepting chemotaxis protein [Propionivibrio dicarboxylicus]